MKKDFLGNEIKIGDRVVVMYAHGSGSSSTNHSLLHTEVVRFTPKMVAFKWPKKYSWEKDEKLGYSENMIVVNAILVTKP